MKESCTVYSLIFMLEKIKERTTHIAIAFFFHTETIHIDLLLISNHSQSVFPEMRATRMMFFDVEISIILYTPTKHCRVFFLFKIISSTTKECRFYSARRPCKQYVRRVKEKCLCQVLNKPDNQHNDLTSHISSFLLL